MNKKFNTPSWFAMIIILLGFIILQSLAYWQYQRGDRKQKQYLTLSQAEQNPHLKPASLIFPEPTLFTLIEVTGQWLEEPIVLLNHYHLEQQQAVRVFQPFLTASSEVIWIDRGLLPLPPSANPTTLLPPIAYPEGERTLWGSIQDYQPLPLWKEETLSQQTPVARYNNPDPKALFEHFQHPTAQYYLKLSASHPESWSPLATFERMPPSKHFGYALQWFIIGWTWIALWLYWHKRTLPICREKISNEPSSSS